LGHAINVELPPFKNGEHNSEKASTIDRAITSSISGSDTGEGATRDKGSPETENEPRNQ